ncbi:putative NADH-flavin reductase [Rhodoblastus acidophilus]|uniref:NAD(P)H-binding protein n=1 Tax=Rhodoblastus acidophilus TaxID=1074 RepID=UPI00222535A6|nr:NAD(P)H-binding protein [Rhodoblastus acidophilus]MCW2283705.1 putative NADH-flavin reductase [Rhodoblastus acidophilus]MCW2332946.1 putative NADH-flavin reductase [Rhodoblastus acidophilus]
MKISLFGATGPTGKYLIEEALRQGYSLSVYTRDAGKLAAYADKIDIVVGDLETQDAIKKCVTGSAAVISALGPNSLAVKGTLPVMHGLGNIMTAMKDANVNRLIQVSTAAYRDPKDRFDFKSQAMLAVLKLIARKGVEDVQATAKLISDSDLNWTLVRIPNLKDGPSDGDIDVGWYGQRKLGTKLSRGNLAKFLVDQIASREFTRAAPGIANRA